MRKDYFSNNRKGGHHCMSDLIKVSGQACLQYVDRPIGLIGEDNFQSNTEAINYGKFSTVQKTRTGVMPYLMGTTFTSHCTITKIKHNTTKRKIGLILDKFDDGGIYVAILGENESIDHNRNVYNYDHALIAGLNQEYDMDILSYVMTKDGTMTRIPFYGSPGWNITNSYYGCVMLANNNLVPFDETLEYDPDIENWGYQVTRSQIENNGWKFTNNKNTTLRFGQGEKNNPIKMMSDVKYNPINFISGDLYFAVSSMCYELEAKFPNKVNSYSEFADWNYVYGSEVETWNQVCIPFNLILTESEQFASAYLNSGTIPPDAILYPLDWANLPKFNDDEDPDNYPDDNKPNDTDRDITPNLPVVPSFTPSMLSNYNYYWLTVSDYAQFIRWFWDDIGAYNDFDDLINKVKGLYNDVASAVVMCRFYPVEVSWIGGTGNQSNIVVGMIEKDGLVDTINQASAPQVQDIGHVHIPHKYNSFCDMTPYTQLSLYLPYHGFVDLDIDILMGHDLYVKGVYDFLTGTLQYLLYYDNEMLINSYIVKMAVDIPITLQTKNDRDSAVFNNVASTVSGLIGAGVGIASGNPIGTAIGVTQGVQSINSGNQSAPLKAIGTVGETGAMYAPPQCAIILRRPTIQGSNKSTSTGYNLKTWKNRVGNLCGYGYQLGSLTGFTQCTEPRITFKTTSPYQSEIDEIYDYLEKGVIL